MDLSKHVEALARESELLTAHLKEAREAAARIPAIEADLSRIAVAVKALGAPQTPEGRKRIGDGQRKRRKTPSSASEIVVAAAEDVEADDQRNRVAAAVATIQGTPLEEGEE